MPRRSCPTSVRSATPRRYDLVIPTKDNSGNKIKTGIIDAFSKKMSRQFGGSTTYDAMGCYQSEESGQTECEPVKVASTVRVYELVNKEPCDVWVDDDEFMERTSSDIATMFGQEGVFAMDWLVETAYMSGEKRPRAQPELIQL